MNNGDIFDRVYGLAMSMSIFPKCSCFLSIRFVTFSLYYKDCDLRQLKRNKKKLGEGGLQLKIKLENEVPKFRTIILSVNRAGSFELTWCCSCFRYLA